MKKNIFDLIIFDFDDTLFDYEKTEERALRESFSYYDLPYKDEYYAIFKEINRKLWKFHNQISAQSTKVMKRQRFELLFNSIGMVFSAEQFSDTYTEKSQNGDLIEGVETVVNKLYNDVQLVIASNGPCTPRIEKLQNSSIAGKLRFYSSESFNEGYKKPDPHFYQAILKNFKIANSKVLVVGDKLSTDILCANDAGLKSVLFKYRNHNEDQNIAKPDYVIEQFTQLLDIVYQEF